MTEMTIRQKQLLLCFLGYYTGEIDGIWGVQSRSAETAFRNDRMQDSTDTSDAAFQHRLRQVIGSGEETAAETTFWKEIRWFRREEFACRCGKCGGFPAEPEELLVRAADRIRSGFGRAMTVSSGVRCGTHNRAVGGISNSRHLAGKAMDFCVAGKTAAEVLSEVTGQPEIRYAYAIDENYVHMDIA